MNISNKQADSILKRLTWAQESDEEIKKDLRNGRQVGMYKLSNVLGTGNFSKVKLASHLVTGEQVAVKIIDKTKLDIKTQKMVLREINIMDKLSHPHLIRLYEVAETLNGLHLILEYAPGGEMFTHISENGPFEENVAKIFFVQIAAALMHLHEHFFIHRDVKAENIFFASAKVVKVGDFGFATRVNTVDQHLMTFCGSPPYAAPELFQDDHYFGPSVDIWALGILLYFMITGSMPFKGNTVGALKHSILEGSFVMPVSVTENCKLIINGILQRKPQNRLSLRNIKNSLWLHNITWPREDSLYTPYPMQRHSENGMSGLEERVRNQLSSIGITSDIIENSLEKGVRSQIIGSYRILMHREASKLCPLSQSSTTINITNNTEIQSISKPVIASLSKESKSKMCDIL